MTDFCPTCGTRLVLSKDNKFHCPKCGYESSVPTKQKFTINHNSSKIAVIDEASANLETLPTINVECEHCGKNRAETWIVAGGSEGISNITFYRCTSCGYTWRETDHG